MIDRQDPRVMMTCPLCGEPLTRFVDACGGMAEITERCMSCSFHASWGCDDEGGDKPGGVKQPLRDRFREGFIAGLREFAWWKNGEQFVGTCGTTLAQAIEQANKEL